MTESYEQWFARTLSFTQWEFLADHFQGPRAVRPNEAPTRVALCNKRLIRVEPASAVYPKLTVLTDKGHDVMCAAMGLMADMLMATGYDGFRKPAIKTKPMTEKIAYGKLPAPARHKVDGKIPADAEHRSR